MTTAAETLHVTQPTLSRQISDLEKELGCTLFTRTNRATFLTEEGMHLRRRAEEIVAMVDRTEMEFLTSELDVHGDIHIGAGETMQITVITDSMMRLRKLYPNIRFHIYSGIADDVVERLDHGMLDFALLFEPVNTERYDIIRVPQQDVTGLLVRSDSPLADHTAIHAEDLLDLPLIVSSRQSVSAASTAQMLGIPEARLNIIGTGNLLYNISQMVLSGLGCALTIDGIIYAKQDSPFRFIPLEQPIYRSLIFAWRKYTTMPTAVSLFANEVRAMVNEAQISNHSG